MNLTFDLLRNFRQRRSLSAKPGDSAGEAPVMDVEAITSVLDSVRVATSLIMDEAARVAETRKDREDGSGLLAQVRLAINRVEQGALQGLVDSYEPRRRTVSRSDLEKRALDAIMDGTTWLSAAELGLELDPEAANPHAAASRWLKNKQVFAIDHRSKKLFPAYVFNESWKPLPALKKVLAILDGYSALRLASWFESTNSWLHGKRPREVIGTDPEAVIRAAEQHRAGAVHG